MSFYSSVWKLYSESFLPLQRHWAQRQSLSLVWADEDPGSLCYGESAGTASVKSITGGSVGQFRLCSSSGDGRCDWFALQSESEVSYVTLEDRPPKIMRLRTHEPTISINSPNLHFISWYTRKCLWQAGVSGLFQSSNHDRYWIQCKVHWL